MAIPARRPDQKPFVPHPEGVYNAVCCDVEDLGMLPTRFLNKDGSVKAQPKVRIVWQTLKKMEDGRPFTLGQRYTNSLHEKAVLYKDLKAWGVPMDEELDLESLIGRPCFVNIVHSAPDEEGRVYANVASIMPLPEGMRPIHVSADYIRKIDRETTQKPNPQKKYEWPEEEQELPYDGAPPLKDSDIPL